MEEIIEQIRDSEKDSVTSTSVKNSFSESLYNIRYEFIILLISFSLLLEESDEARFIY